MIDLDACAPPDYTPDVPTADELFGDEALERLRCSQEIARTVRELRTREATIARQAEAATRSEWPRVYTQLVTDILFGVGIALPDATYDDPASLFEAVASLPVVGKTASARRKAREVARVAMLFDKGGLHVPEGAEDFHVLWEQAMRGEPRWSADHPSSAFRTGSAVLRGPWPERVILHKCMDPNNVSTWLDRLVALLSDERFAPEMRAACGLGLHDWIHPFADGNGHTGRLLMLAMLGGFYSHPTLACLAYELVGNRAATIRQFKRLRERNADALGFCLGMLNQVRDAQERALNMLCYNS